MAEIKDPENTLIMETTKGKVVIELLPSLAPEPRQAHQGTGRASRPMTVSCSTASSKASWPRPAT
jgi:hypothetical protein